MLKTENLKSVTHLFNDLAHRKWGCSAASDIGAVTSDHPRIIDHEDILGVALITAALVRSSSISVSAARGYIQPSENE